MHTIFNTFPYALVILPGIINLALSVPCENTHHGFCICMVSVHICDGYVYIHALDMTPHFNVCLNLEIWPLVGHIRAVLDI